MNAGGKGPTVAGVKLTQDGRGYTGSYRGVAFTVKGVLEDWRSLKRPRNISKALP